MKRLLLGMILIWGSISFSHAQCSVQVNDTLLSNYNYVLSAANPTGTPPFLFSWNVVNAYGTPLPYTTGMYGDSITIDAMTLMNNYGCVIYQLCMTDSTGCMTCTGDTAILDIPFPCYSQFISTMEGENIVSVQMIMPIPTFLIASQYVTWTDGNGQSQYQPYFDPMTTIVYTPGPSNPTDKFVCCILTNLINGGNSGCISCDSVQYTNSSTAGIAAWQQEKIQIAPNPVSSAAKITAGSPIEALGLFSLEGKEIELSYSKEGNAALLNVAGLPKGVYLVRVKTASGMSEERIIKD